MAKHEVELTIHEPGRKTLVDEGELGNLLGQHLIRTGDDGEPLARPLDDAPVPAAKTPAKPAAAAAATTKEN